MTTIYGSCVRWLGKGVLICGPSGSGKSDLCLRLSESGAELVADDQTIVENRDGKLFARCPDPLRGLLEVRGIGIIETPFVPETEIHLKLDLRTREKIDRMPLEETETIEGVDIPVFATDAFELSAVLKIKTYLQLLSAQRRRIS